MDESRKYTPPEAVQQPIDKPRIITEFISAPQPPSSLPSPSSAAHIIDSFKFGPIGSESPAGDQVKSNAIEPALPSSSGVQLLTEFDVREAPRQLTDEDMLPQLEKDRLESAIPSRAEVEKVLLEADERIATITEATKKQSELIDGLRQTTSSFSNGERKKATFEAFLEASENLQESANLRMETINLVRQDIQVTESRLKSAVDAIQGKVNEIQGARDTARVEGSARILITLYGMQGGIQQSLALLERREDQVTQLLQDGQDLSRDTGACLTRASDWKRFAHLFTE